MNHDAIRERAVDALEERLPNRNRKNWPPEPIRHTPIVLAPARPTAWRKQAACRGVDTFEAFTKNQTEQQRFIADYCDVCPARAECLEDAWLDEWADVKANTHGIRGGLVADRRARLWRARPRPVLPTTADIKNHGTVGGYYAHLRHKDPTCEACRHAYRTQRQANRAGRAKKAS